MAPTDPVNHVSKNHASRTWRRYSISIRFLMVLLSGTAFAVWITFFPPTDLIRILVGIFLTTFFIASVTSFINRNAQIFVSLFVLTFLAMSYIIGFDLLNTVLLLSFIIGLSLLFKNG